MELTARFEHTDDGWWIGYVEEVPGAHTQGRSLEEARDNLRDALRMVLEANKEISARDSGGRDVIREPLQV